MEPIGFLIFEKIKNGSRCLPAQHPGRSALARPRRRGTGHPAAPGNPLGGSTQHPGTQRISTQHPGTRWAAAPRNPALIGTPESGSTRRHPGTYCTRWVLGARWVADPLIRWVRIMRV